jgi:hypothetical protein
MFGVLVIILRPDQIAGLGFSLGQCHLPLIVSSRVLGVVRLSAGAMMATAGPAQTMPPVWAARFSVCPSAILHAPLGYGR